MNKTYLQKYSHLLVIIIPMLIFILWILPFKNTVLAGMILIAYFLQLILIPTGLVLGIILIFVGINKKHKIKYEILWLLYISVYFIMARNIAFFAEMVFFPQIDVEMTTTEIQRSLGYLINSFIYTIPLSIIIFYKNKI